VSAPSRRNGRVTPKGVRPAGYTPRTNQGSSAFARPARQQSPVGGRRSAPARAPAAVRTGQRTGR
jgi:hypothetical protein